MNVRPEALRASVRLHKPSGRRRRNEIPRRRRKNLAANAFDGVIYRSFNVLTRKFLPFFCAAGPALTRGAGAPCLVPRLREPFGLASRLREPAASCIRSGGVSLRMPRQPYGLPRASEPFGFLGGSASPSVLLRYIIFLSKNEL